LREDNGSGRGASFQCSNIFSIFAVLVFLFALVDFIMGMDGRRRRRRDVSGCNLEEPLLGGDSLDLEDPLTREASLAVALLWRGNLLSDSHRMDRNTFLVPQTTYNNNNSESSGKSEKIRRRYGGRREEVGCDATVRCKAAKSAASLGRYGAALAFLVGESPDTCLEDPACDQLNFPFWQDEGRKKGRRTATISDKLLST